MLVHAKLLQRKHAAAAPASRLVNEGRQRNRGDQTGFAGPPKCIMLSEDLPENPVERFVFGSGSVFSSGVGRQELNGCTSLV